MTKDTPKVKFIISFAKFLAICYYRTLVIGFMENLVNESRVCLVDIIPPWLSMLIYHLGDDRSSET
jgi:hypothetical protein